MRRIARLSPFVLAAILAACAAATGRGAASATRCLRAPDPAPFALVLSFTGGTLACVISNTSAHPQAFLQDRLCHPARLRLFQGGRELQAFDRRAIMKFDNRLRTSMLTALAPGASAVLQTDSIMRRENQLRLWWGPLQFNKLATGDCEAVVEYQAEARSLYDDETEKWVERPYWTNARPLVSNRLRFRL